MIKSQQSHREKIDVKSELDLLKSKDFDKVYASKDDVDEDLSVTDAFRKGKTAEVSATPAPKKVEAPVAKQTAPTTVNAVQKTETKPASTAKVQISQQQVMPVQSVAAVEQKPAVIVD